MPEQQKLENLLQLPSSFELAKARLLLLRLTIPVDIYSSPILVEVDGVECQLRVQSVSESSSPLKSHLNYDRKRKRPQSRRVGTEVPSKTANKAKWGSNFGDDEDSDPAIPTAADLAESF